ncbi:MAG: ABC transporter ATP-binding protein [Methylacidiphilales bacterium]|nr:ABC transporter ATP-binding protein [Candidatus Methylacidiphilales bacterium]
MLQLSDIVVERGPVENPQALLKDISLFYPAGHFAAIVGASGCGKSTLLKVIAGLMESTNGKIHWRGRDLAEEHDLEPAELGYVPQFSIFHDHLTVWECAHNACRLRVGGLAGRDVRERVSQILEYVGLLEISDRRASVLSGGQRRRLGLALELVSNPALLLCDEVTSGLDPKAEDEIVKLLRHLASGERTVLSVTHSLRHLHVYDSVTVLNQGTLAYQGPPDFLLEYFSASSPENVFPRLAEEEPGFWLEKLHTYKAVLPKQAQASGEILSFNQAEMDEAPPEPAGFFMQFWILFCRRWRLFLRDHAQLGLQLSLLVVFPLVVILFAYNGLPQIQNMSMEADPSILQVMKERLEFNIQTTHIGSLVSGLVMFQVVLLTLMGSNNAAREIASERLIFEKEKLGGLNVGSYLAGKLGFLVFLVAAQSVCMAFAVKIVCRLPGDPIQELLLLFLANLAMTVVCLAISSWSRTTEQASLISIYLVGFQLPLSGAVLALPDFLGTVVRPFIAAYWSWSGYIQSMRDTRFYDLVASITLTPLAEVPLCIWVLVFHILTGLLLAWLGGIRSQWE